MNDSDMEKKLLESGFTVKEINAIKSWANRGSVSCSVVLIQIRRVFIVSTILLLGLMALLISEFFRLNGGAGFYAVLAGFLLCLTAACMIAPMKLGVKITLNFKRIYNFNFPH